MGMGDMLTGLSGSTAKMQTMRKLDGALVVIFFDREDGKVHVTTRGHMGYV